MHQAHYEPDKLPERVATLETRCGTCSAEVHRVREGLHATNNRVTAVVLQVTELCERDKRTDQVLEELTAGWKDLQEAMNKLRLTIAYATGAASVAIPLLSWALPEIWKRIMP